VMEPIWNLYDARLHDLLMYDTVIYNVFKPRIGGAEGVEPLTFALRKRRIGFPPTAIRRQAPPNVTEIVDIHRQHSTSLRSTVVANW
jgi:hypothetical protein